MKSLLLLAACLLVSGAARAIPPEATYVGEKTCIKCHDIESGHFGHTQHAKAFRQNPRNELEGRVWHKTIETRDLDAMRRDHDVISTRLFGGRTIVHVLAPETPGAGFGPAPAVLEDVYFSTLSAVRRAA